MRFLISKKHRGIIQEINIYLTGIPGIPKYLIGIPKSKENME